MSLLLCELSYLSPQSGQVINLGEDHWVSIADGIGFTKCRELNSIFAVYWDTADNLFKSTFDKEFRSVMIQLSSVQVCRDKLWSNTVM